MSEFANERIVYFNGQYIPESQALVPYRERSFIFGDGAFDLTRTFNHTIFKLDEHIERLYYSMRALRLDAGISAEEITDITRIVVEKNLHLLDADEDYWVGQRVTRGVNKVDGDNWNHYGPTVIVECVPMPIKERAHYYRDGVPVVIPSVRRTTPDALTPRAKTHNYLNMIVAELEVKAHDSNNWAVLLDHNGNLCEGMGSNIFVVRNGVLLTPREQFVLPGISRQTVIDLAAELGIPCQQTDIDLFDGYNADEAFITSTSLCICPVTSINGAVIGDGTVYGPITQRLIDAYVELVSCDFIQQYLDALK
ncbi:MAG: aminotransferase class IV [Rhodospirillaceae bacterium]|nr:aminotransferase class IV [Rhodospirillaceae bacterium]MBL6930704.1 aminotransferase class IV [Rhodospirillales bacterium]